MSEIVKRRNTVGPLRNLRQEKFCQEYIKSAEPADAYLKAGYRSKNRRVAGICAIQLLTKPNILNRLRELQEKTTQVFIATEIADRTIRVFALRDRWRRLQTVIEERAKALEMAGAPGGKTGLLCRRLKMIGSGKNAEVVEEYEVDPTLLREMRAHEEQAAKELGQWVEKGQVEVTGPVTEVLARRFARVKERPSGDSG